MTSSGIVACEEAEDAVRLAGLGVKGSVADGGLVTHSVPVICGKFPLDRGAVVVDG